MNKNEERLKQVFQLINELYEGSPCGVIITGVEIDETGYPTARALKCTANPAQTIAGITILQKMLTETMEEVHQRVEAASDISSKIDAVMEKMKDKLEASDLDGTEDDAEKLRKFIEDFKKRLGK